MKIDKTLHPLAKHLIEKSPTKEDYYKLICYIDDWYLRQLDSWMDWIRTTDASQDEILRRMDCIAMSLRLQVPSDVSKSNPEWEEAWNAVRGKWCGCGDELQTDEDIKTGKCGICRSLE